MAAILLVDGVGSPLLGKERSSVGRRVQTPAINLVFEYMPLARLLLSRDAYVKLRHIGSCSLALLELVSEDLVIFTYRPPASEWNLPTPGGPYQLPVYRFD